MKLIIGNQEFLLSERENSNLNLFLLAKKIERDGYIIKKTNAINTFFLKNKIDIIGINEKDSVIFKYQNAAKNKIVEINNDKKNTSIIVLPINTSKYLKIGDILSLVNENII